MRELGSVSLEKRVLRRNHIAVHYCIVEWHGEGGARLKRRKKCWTHGEFQPDTRSFFNMKVIRQWTWSSEGLQDLCSQRYSEFHWTWSRAS